MPLYQATPIDYNRNTGSIGEMMLRSGDVQANALRQNAALKSSAIQNVGETAAGTLGSILQGRQDKKQHEVIAQVLHAVAKPDGTYDTAQLPGLLHSAGLDDHVQPLIEFADKQNQAIIGSQHTAAETKKLTAETTGTLPETPAQKATREAREAAQTETARHNLVTEGTAQSTTARTDAAQVETARHNTELEKIARMTAGRAEAAQAETVRHDKAMEARPVAGQINANPPGDWTKQGSDFLSTIPAQWRTTVQKIAQYDEDPSKVASMRGGMRETLMNWVNQVNPEYDSTMFTNRAPTRKAFTTGTQGQQINAMNTAMGHIDQLTDVAAALGNGSFVPGNALWNSVKTTFGADAPTNFDTLKDALAGEVSSVLSKGSATVSGIADAKEKIKSASSPEQLAGYVKTLIPLMGSKLSELNFQYHQAMGERDPFQALSPESVKILTKHGFDPAHITIAGGGGAKEGETKPIPGFPGTEQTYKGGKWIRTK